MMFNANDLVKVTDEDAMFYLPVGFDARVLHNNGDGTYQIKVIDEDYWDDGEPTGDLYFDDVPAHCLTLKEKAA